MMVFNIQNYKVFGLCLLSDILKKTRKDSISETVYFLPQVMGETPALLSFSIIGQPMSV
jgi:hypothetical protein